LRTRSAGVTAVEVFKQLVGGVWDIREGNPGVFIVRGAAEAYEVFVTVPRLTRIENGSNMSRWIVLGSQLKGLRLCV
jgi:hypothetical protein